MAYTSDKQTDTHRQSRKHNKTTSKALH